MVVDSFGACHDRTIADLPDQLSAGDLLVINNTSVLPARLAARREGTGGGLELLLLREISATRWEVLLRPARRARPGQLYRIDGDLTFEIVDRLAAGKAQVAFSEPILPHLDRLGRVPLPPYIRRSDVESDRLDYQTVYASRPGAVAAPTAGLHLTREILSQLRRAGVGIVELTLHIGLGTFRPVDSEEVERHRMDSERYELPQSTVDAIRRSRRRGARIVGVGTTVVRALESAARGHGPELSSGTDETSLFITPGFDFQVVDLLLTNFHLPRSTLLMLVCAFAGKERIMSAYQQAIARRYRFYSYGDAMLVGRLHTRNGRRR